MNYFNVLNPKPKRNPIDAHAISERLDSLDGKTIAIVSNKKHHLDVMALELMKEYPNTRFIFIPDMPAVRGQTTVWRELGEGFRYMKFTDFMEDPTIADAAIVGCGFCGNATITLTGYACEMEKKGVPVVVVIIPTMVTNIADAIIRSSNAIPTLRSVVVNVPQNAGDTMEEAVKFGFAPQLAKDVIPALTKPRSDAEKYAGNYPLPEEPEYVYQGDDYEEAMAAMEGDLARCILTLAPSMYTDGSPAKLPLTHIVDKMLAGTSHAPDEIIGTLGESDATVRLVAINGAMAGCKPSYMPMLLALTECMINSDTMVRLNGAGGYFCFGVVGCGNLYPMEIKLNDGGPMGTGPAPLTQGVPANTTIGRFLRLMMLNVGGAEPGAFEGKGLGSPHKTSIVIREAQDSPWSQFSTDMGFEDGDDTVSLCTMWSDMSMGFTCKYTGPEATNEKEKKIQELLGSTAAAAKYMNEPMKGLFLYMKHATAVQLAAAGISRQDVKQWLSTHCVDTLANARLLGVGERKIIDVWSVQGKVVQPLTDWPEEWKSPDTDPNTMVAFYPNPDNIHIVIGYGGMGSGGMLMNGAPRWTANIDPWR